MFSTCYSKTGPSSIFQSLVSYSWTSSMNLSIGIRVIHHWKELFEIDTVRKQQLVDLGCCITLYTYIYIPHPSFFPSRLLCVLEHSLSTETCALWEAKHALSLRRLPQDRRCRKRNMLALSTLCGSWWRRHRPSTRVGAEATSVWGLKLLVYAALSYQYMRPSATTSGGLKYTNKNTKKNRMLST